MKKSAKLFVSKPIKKADPVLWLEVPSMAYSDLKKSINPKLYITVKKGK